MENMLNNLKSKGININIVNDQLVIDAPKGRLDKNLLEDLKSRKKEILQYLKQNDKLKNESISLIEEQDHYSVSYSQKRLWFTFKALDEPGLYNVPSAFVMKSIDIEIFKESIAYIIKRHEILRTSIIEVDGEPRQMIHSENELIDFEYIDLTEVTDQEYGVQNLLKKYASQPFRFDAGGLLRIKLIKCNAERFIVLLVTHHLIFDGWSSDVFFRELLEVYQTNLNHASPNLIELPIQFKDFVAWQMNRIKDKCLASCENYWKERYKEEVSIAELPSDVKSTAKKSFVGALEEIILDETITSCLKSFAVQHQASVYSILMAALNLLFYRYGGQNSVVFGIPVMGREHKVLENQIGFYVNTLPLHVKINTHDSFLNLLNKVNEAIWGAYENQMYPIDKIFDTLDRKSFAHHNPLYSTGFTWHDPVSESKDLNDKNSEILPLDTGFRIAKEDLWFHGTIRNDQIILGAEYSVHLYSKDKIKTLFQHLNTILGSVIENGNLNILEIPFFTPEEKMEIVSKFNNTKVPYPKNQTIQSIFETIAVENPDKIAVIYQDQHLTYKELNRITNGLANLLIQNYKIGPSRKVALLSERSTEFIIAILGILKAGAAYVPVDPNYPNEQIKLILTHDDISLLMTTSDRIFNWASTDNLQLFALDLQLLEIDKTESLPNISIDPECEAYIMYTSGTTGQSKGVRIAHQSVIRLVKNTNYMSFSNPERILQIGSLSFDASTFEIWGSLLNGGELHMVDRMEFLEPNALKNNLKRRKITSIFMTTSWFNQLVDLDSSIFNELKYLLVGGEKVSTIHMNKLIRCCHNVNLIHIYGPTENTSFSTYLFVNQIYNQSLPLGYPISNSTIYILDQHNQLLPKGIPGEIWLGGDGVALGYHQRPEETKNKFVNIDLGNGDERLYRTGDLGCWNFQGQVEYLGRNDDQIKIRGHRIELSELKEHLEMFPKINDCYIAVKEIDNEKILVAYYISEKNIKETDLRQFMAERCPHYMLPDVYMKVDEFTLNLSGKLDLKKLPEPIAINRYKTRNGKTQSGTLQKLITICEKLLNRSPVLPQDNFFEIGGHSLKAMQLLMNINQELNVQIELKDIFAFPILEELVSIIERGVSSNYEPIKALPQAKNYQVSHAQRRIWVLDQLDENKYVYNVPVSFIFNGELDLKILKQTFGYLLERHEILRTIFESVNEVPMQQVLPIEKVNFKFTFEELKSKLDRAELIRNFAIEEAKTPFDLKVDLPIRCKIIHLEKDQYLFLLTIHHIACDGWSLKILFDELQLVYNAMVEDLPINLTSLKVQYKDYVGWQYEIMQGLHWEEHKTYWFKKLSKPLPVLDLPTDYSRPAIKTFNSNSDLKYNFSITEVKQIKSFCEKNGVSLYVTFLAALKTLFYQYTGQDDIIIGSPVAGRQHKDLENQIGFYLNTLVFRTKIGDKQNFHDLLLEVNNTVMDAYSHQFYPFDQLVDDLKLDRDISRSALFDVFFVYNNFEGLEVIQMGDKGLKNVSVKPFNSGFSANKFDLTFYLSENDGHCFFSVGYNIDLFRRERIENMITHLKNLLLNVIKDPHQNLRSYPIIGNLEYNFLINEFNSTVSTENTSSGFLVHFHRQVERCPNRVSMMQDGQMLTYQQLNNYANQVAHYLQNKGFTPGTNIAILSLRNFDMVIGILGIIKAGCAYVPVDPNYPENRQNYILQNAEVRYLLTSLNCQPSIHILKTYDSVAIKEILESERNNTDPQIKFSADSLAYVIHTSGSTGKPKGVMIKHVSLNNLIQWVNKRFMVGEEDRLLFITSICFDLSVYDIFGSLAAGSQIQIVQQNEIQDSVRLIELIKSREITIWNSVPTTMSFLVEEMAVLGAEPIESLRLVLLSGDWIPVNLPLKIKQFFPNAQVISLGGATEGTVWSNYYLIDEVNPTWKSIPYGIPIDNSFFYILDEKHQPVPTGIPGELYIGGIGIAKGYINDLEKTRSAFFPDPFHSNLGGMMYKTGDIGRMMWNGNIEFLGRKDRQVKIRGFRVEIGEVEYQLNALGAVERGIVKSLENTKHDHSLCAYIQLRHKTDLEEIKSQLKQFLPEYMVPDFIYTIDEFPLDVNGKIDHKSLPHPREMSENEIEQTSGQVSETEKVLLDIWMEILGLAHINMNISFFELGGHSLKATQMVSRIYRKFGVKIGIREIFLHSTLRELSKVIDQAQVIQYDQTIKNEEQNSYYPASYAQKRLWVLNSIDKNACVYNIVSTYRLVGVLDIPALEKAFSVMWKRHESLRTVFQFKDGEVVQHLLPKDSVGIFLSLYRLTDEQYPLSTANALVKQESWKLFDLEKGPLIRANLFQVAENEYVLHYVMHPIISDGWSMDLFDKELRILYQAFVNQSPSPLKPLTYHYRDYAIWQRKNLNTDEYKQSQKYWIDRFNDQVPRLNLPLDAPRPVGLPLNGGVETIKIDHNTTLSLQKLTSTQGCSIFMTLVAIVKVLLYKYSGQTDIVIGSPIAGRVDEKFETLIGCFINNIAIRTKFSDSMSFKEVLEVVKENTLDAYEHQMYPFDKLIADLNLPRDSSRPPLYDVVVDLHNTLDSRQKDKEDTTLLIEGFDAQYNVSTSDLRFEFNEIKSGILVRLDYNAQIFSELRIKRMLSHFNELINAVLENPDNTLNRLNYLSDQEDLLISKMFNNEGEKEKTFESLISLFLKKVKQTPKAYALQMGDKKISYSELDLLSEILIENISDQLQINQGDVVGVSTNNPEHMIIAMLGIMKAGAIYLPIDTSLPKNRKLFMLNDSNASLLLIDAVNIFEYTEFKGNLFPLDLQLEEVKNLGNRKKVDPEAPAYIIYTSGTTGRTKGVVVAHFNTVNIISDHIKRLGICQHDHILQFSSFSFDVSICEIFMALHSGATLVLLDNIKAKDTEQLQHYMIENEVSVVAMTPTMLRNIDFDGLKSMRAVISGGETPEIDVAIKLAQHFDYYNAYGPTEAAICSTIHKLENHHNKNNYKNGIPIGKPIDNVIIKIVDQFGAKCGIGVPGEILISGLGVSQGYLNQVELTQEKFVYADKARWYRTGDLGYWMESGEIMFLGRNDDQIKMNGYRIDPKEIEYQLLQRSSIYQVYVVADITPQGTTGSLLCFYTGSSTKGEELRNIAKQNLPYYMIPSSFIHVESLPINASGKVDLQALLKTKSLAEKQNITPFKPQDELEEKVFAIWCEVLDKKDFGPKQNFFELGGNSLLVVEAFKKFETLFPGMIKIGDLFDKATISQQCEVIKSQSANIDSNRPNTETIDF